MAFAMRTSLRNAEYSPGHHDLSPAATGGACLDRRPFFRPRTAARFTAVQFPDGNFLLTTRGRLLQRDFQIVTQVIPTLRARAFPAAAAEDAVENAGAAAAKDFL